jgi:hypothetical protein
MLESTTAVELKTVAVWKTVVWMTAVELKKARSSVR